MEVGFVATDFMSRQAHSNYTIVLATPVDPRIFL